MKKGISAVLIAKNEAKVIERCLESLGGLDEVVILDTGSTDGTPEIAEKAGAKVYGVPWKGPFHFADARNAAMMRASHDWVLSIDADEVLREGSMGPMIDCVRGKPKAGAFSVLHVNRSREDGSGGEYHTLRPALFRPSEMRWKYRIHEQLFARNRVVEAAFLKRCVIDHLPEENKGGRREQNIELLELCVKETPEHLFAHLQLGIEYNLAEKWGTAVAPLKHYLTHQKKLGDLERCAVFMQLGRALSRSAEIDEALQAFWTAHMTVPTRREPLYWGALELMSGRWNRIAEAAHWLEEAMKIEPSEALDFSLYSAEVQGNLVQEGLDVCRKLLDEAKKEWEKRQGAKA